MIIAHVNGGLGNQLFQYAAGRALADRLGVPLGLDLRHFDRNPAHDFSLEHFNVHFEHPDNRHLPPSQYDHPVGHLIWRYFGLKPHLFREKSLGYNDRIREVRDNAYIKGYWQSERYFRDVAEVIHRDLEIISPPSQTNNVMLKEISSTTAVSLHIRRGDYVSDLATNATHGTCTLEYYQRAARHIADAVGDEPSIYTFSDDPDWVRDNLRLPFKVHFVDQNDAKTNYEDLRLMSACRHHIIANSSFSWWGAWLNPSPDKIVVAPQRWFAHSKMHNPDIIPDDWVRM